MKRFWNRKGWISQNVLVACDFSLRFNYILSGWEGSAADSRIYDDARRRDFLIPPNKYYLADAGFGLCDGLLTPYRQVRYHLKEWSRGNQRYAFNYIFYLFYAYFPSVFNSKQCYDMYIINYIICNLIDFSGYENR